VVIGEEVGRRGSQRGGERERVDRRKKLIKKKAYKYEYVCVKFSLF